MSVDSPPSREGSNWAHDLVETSPEQLRGLRVRKIALAVGGGLIAVALVAGGLFFAFHDSRPDVVVVAGFEPHDNMLSSYMLAVPAGASPGPSGSAGRELDEDAAAEATGEWKLLRRYKFTRGYERGWISVDGALITVRLMRFRGAENAARYLRDSMDLTGRESDVQSSAVAGVPGGSSVSGTVPVGGSDTHVTISSAPAGDVVVFVIAAGDRSAVTPEATESLLVEAYARLK